jgi:phosphoglycolate phosphatase-like HAD superfamily hydrolase
MIGDKVSDVEAGRRAGCKTVLLGSGTTDEGSAPGPDYGAAGWGDAIRPILESVAAR